MKHAPFLALAIFLANCQQAPKAPEAPMPAEKPSVPAVDPNDPDQTDTIPTGMYTLGTADPQMIANLKNALTQDLLKSDLANIPAEQRKFRYQSYDLNGDGKDEYLVGFENNPYFCGSGGCTFMLLDHEGALVTKFTVSRSPFVVLDTQSSGWYDLVVESGGKMRKLAFNGKSYPSNPSVAPEYKTKPGDDLPRLLWGEKPMPTIRF